MGSTNILNTYADTNTLTITSIPDIYSTYYNNYTITTSCPHITKLESDSNELKINIKKFQIKFNFNL